MYFYVDFHNLCFILHPFIEKEEWRGKRIKERKFKKGKNLSLWFSLFLLLYYFDSFRSFHKQMKRNQKKKKSIQFLKSMLSLLLWRNRKGGNV
jgi:hypothetical protein